MKPENKNKLILSAVTGVTAGAALCNVFQIASGKKSLKDRGLSLVAELISLWFVAANTQKVWRRKYFKGGDTK